jgi:hypothetical protein
MLRRLAVLRVYASVGFTLLLFILLCEMGLLIDILQSRCHHCHHYHLSISFRLRITPFGHGQLSNACFSRRSMLCLSLFIPPLLFLNFFSFSSIGGFLTERTKTKTFLCIKHDKPPE